MNKQKNTIYNNLLTPAAIGICLVSSSAEANTDYSNLTVKSSYDKYVDYSLKKQGTIADSNIQNNIDMLKLLEISKFSEKLNNIYGYGIINSWIPADNLIEKTCLFISLENQDELSSKPDTDLELDIYLSLEKEIENSNFFNMIALL